jgi:DNA invertase Pin-like site-specific DNA recombinase
MTSTRVDSQMSNLKHLFAAFAEMERGIIRERVCAGVRAAKARGTRLGCPGAFSGVMKPSSCGARG